MRLAVLFVAPRWYAPPNASRDDAVKSSSASPPGTFRRLRPITSTMHAPTTDHALFADVFDTHARELLRY